MFLLFYTLPICIFVHCSFVACVLSCCCHSVALWSFCHYNKFLVCNHIQTYLANKAPSDSDSDNTLITWLLLANNRVVKNWYRDSPIIRFKKKYLSKDGTVRKVKLRSVYRKCNYIKGTVQKKILNSSFTHPHDVLYEKFKKRFNCFFFHTIKLKCQHNTDFAYNECPRTFIICMRRVLNDKYEVFLSLLSKK